MTAEVYRVFSHDYNLLAVAEQEYEFASKHRNEVLQQDFRNPEQQKRFQYAQERWESARDTYFRLMILYG